MIRYFLKGSWQEERQEVTKKQYIEARDGVGSHTRAGHNFASLSVGDSFIGRVVSGWIEDDKSSMNFVDWALPEQLDPPTEEEIIFVMASISKSAKKARAFDKYVSGPMYKWLKGNLENAHIILLDGEEQVNGSLNTHWVAVGINEEAAEKYASHI